MDKLFIAHKIAWIAILWCLCNLALDATVFDGEHFAFWEVFPQASEAGDTPILSEPHHPDHEFSLAPWAAIRMQFASSQERRAAYVPASSQAPAPLLPPPKTA